MIQGVKLNGSGDDAPVIRTLRTGALRMLYERGSLRCISAGGYEIIRMIYFAVRDKDWITVTPDISGESVTEKGNGFEIRYRANYRYKDIEFEADISIVSLQENLVILEMKGLARSTFLKNRIGFCILHPVDDCAGHECKITHPDGTSSPGRFPEDVSPHQPFKDIRSMQWNINESLKGCLHFEGDVFETEDQRNWTDASFKTYSTPLNQPYPVELARGSEIYQRIEFSLEGKIPGIDRDDKRIIFHVGKPAAGKLPGIGVCSSSRLHQLTGMEAGILKNINFSHIRGELILCGSDLENKYASFAEEALITGLPAEICLYFGDDPLADLSKFLIFYHHKPFPVKRFIVFSVHSKVTENSLLATVVPALRTEFPGIPVGAGTNCNFAQLNRQRPDCTNIDFVTFAIHPQEHASDERTLIENTAAQQYAVQSAVKSCMQKPVVISPVTLQRRFNANRDNFEVPGPEKEMPLGVDVRQMSLFCAAWTVGSLKYLLESDVSSVTYYETVGERGLFMGDSGSSWPGIFKAGKGMIFPVYHIFRWLLNKNRSEVKRCYSTNPLVLNGFAVSDKSSGLVFISNMTWQKQKFLLSGVNDYKIVLRMNAGNFDSLTRDLQFALQQNPMQMSAKSIENTLQPFETMILEYDVR